MAALTIQSIDQDGLTPSYTAAAGGGDTVVVGAGSFLHVKNGGGGSITVTLVTPGTVSSLAIADQTVSVGAGAESMIALPDLYKDPATGRGSITYSGVTTVTVANLRAPVSA